MADKQDEILKLLHGLHAILPTLATKADLEEVRAVLPTLATKADLEELRAEVGGLRGEVGGVRAEVGDLSAEVGDLSADVGELRADVAAVHSGLDELRRVTSVNHYKAIGRIDQVDVRLDRVITQLNLDGTNH